MGLALNMKPTLRAGTARMRAELTGWRPAGADVMLAVGCVSLLVVGLGLLGVPGYHRLQLRAKAAAVVGNAATVQLAAETYAATHAGRYASDPLDLLAYLPQGEPPTNPYSDKAVEFGGAAGDLTYREIGAGDNYIIEAFAMGPGGKPRLVASLAGRTGR